MRKYKGYYIDGFYFTCKADIDAFIREKAIKRLKMLIGFFHRDGSMEASVMLSNHELYMETHLGFTPAEIEDMEIAFY